MKASGRVAAPARTAKAASVAVSRVHGDKVATPAAKPATAATATPKPVAKTVAKPAAKEAPTAAAKETPKPGVSVTPTPAAKQAATPAAKEAAKPAAKEAAKPAATEAPTPAAQETPNSTARDAPKPVAKAAAKPAPNAVAPAEVKPAAAPAEGKPGAPAKPAAKPPAAKAASAPAATKVAAAVPPTVATAPSADRPAVAQAMAQATRPVAPPPAHPAPPSHLDRRPGPVDRNPPRVPSKAEIFVEGDYVVYPTHGVGKVERIAVEEIAGHRLELIHITFEENRMTLRVPVAKARTAGLRKLATRKLFDDAMTVLKGRARIKRTMWSRRAQEYEAKINSGDPLAIAEVVRDLHRNAGQPDQSFSERQIYEAAMDRLAAELAALDKTDKPTAVTKLGDFLKTV